MKDKVFLDSEHLGIRCDWSISRAAKYASARNHYRGQTSLFAAENSCVLLNVQDYKKMNFPLTKTQKPRNGCKQFLHFVLSTLDQTSSSQR